VSVTDSYNIDGYSRHTKSWEKLSDALRQTHPCTMISFKTAELRSIAYYIIIYFIELYIVLIKNELKSDRGYK